MRYRWIDMLKTKSAAMLEVMEAFMIDLETGGDGLMVDDVVELTRLDTNQVAPRVFHLVKDGILEATGLRGTTRYGKSANIWRVTDGARALA